MSIGIRRIPRCASSLLLLTSLVFMVGAQAQTPTVRVINPSLAGVITSTPQGINCGAGNQECAAEIERFVNVTLTASSPPGVDFYRFIGDGCNKECNFQVNRLETVEAYFSDSGPDPYPELISGQPVLDQRAGLRDVPPPYFVKVKAGQSLDVGFPSPDPLLRPVVFVGEDEVYRPRISPELCVGVSAFPVGCALTNNSGVDREYLITAFQLDDSQMTDSDEDFTLLANVTGGEQEPQAETAVFERSLNVGERISILVNGRGFTPNTTVQLDGCVGNGGMRGTDTSFGYGCRITGEPGPRTVFIVEPSVGEIGRFPISVGSRLPSAVGEIQGVRLVDNVFFGPISADCISCAITRRVQIENTTDLPIALDRIYLQDEFGLPGSSSGFTVLDYDGISVNGEGTAAAGMFIIPAKSKKFITVKLDSGVPAIGDLIEARLVLDVREIQRVSAGAEFTFSAALTAESGADAFLSSQAFDARSVIDSVQFGSGATIDSDGNPISTEQVREASTKREFARNGIVADGNARIILDARTNLVSGNVRFEITNKGDTQAQIYPLKNSPTYQDSDPDEGIYHTTSTQFVDAEIEVDANGNGRAFAILRAGEQYLGFEDTQDIMVKVCVLDSASQCSVSYVQSIKETRAPAMVVHGLWSSRDSFFGRVADTENGFEYLNLGLYESLLGIEDTGAPRWPARASKRIVGWFDYSDRADRAPSEILPPDRFDYAASINGLCFQARQQGFACSRVDVLAHSMGGLVTREFIDNNRYFRSKENYMQGSIRRLVTIGTPHFGSGFGNWLTDDDRNEIDCIRDDRYVVVPPRLGGVYVGSDGEIKVDKKRKLAPGENMTPVEILSNYEILEAGTDTIALYRDFLKLAGKKSDRGAIEYLAYKSSGLKGLNSRPQKGVYARALYGDIGGDSIVASEWAFITNSIVSQSGCTPQDIFLNMKSDGIVPEFSGKGRLEGSSRAPLPGVRHNGMGVNDSVIRAVNEALDGPLSLFQNTL